jgi:hypothetical protein
MPKFHRASSSSFFSSSSSSSSSSLFSFSSFFFFFFFFFFFGALQLTLPEAPQHYGLLYYPRIGQSDFLHQFRAATPPKQRKLEV